jgi:hypothetical protein
LQAPLVSRAVLTTARIRRGELNGAADALGPVLDLSPEQRINGIVQSVHEFHRALNDMPASPTARDLQERIENYVLAPARALSRTQAPPISVAIGPANAASIAATRQLGMTYEGRIRDHVYTNGQWRDSLLYSMLVDEWLAYSRSFHMAGVLAVLIHAAASSDSGFGAAAGDLLGQRLTEGMIAETPALAVQSCTATPGVSTIITQPARDGDHAAGG